MSKFLYILKLLAFWLIFFLLFRLGFVAYNWNLFSDSSIQSILYSFGVALRLDVSTCCYLLLPSFLIYSFYLFFPYKLIEKIHLVLGFVLLFIAMAISFSNILLYKEWQALISMRALSFLRYPKEVIASLSAFYLVVAVLSIVLLQTILFIFWKRWLNFPTIKKGNLFAIIAFVLGLPFILFLGLRGGWQLIPINESAVYSSNKTVVNHSAVNPLWYLGNSIYNEYSAENNYHFMSEEQAASLLDSIYTYQESDCPKILKVTRPNIVFLILESHTAAVIKSLGGDAATCPNLEKLIKEGMLFTQIYGSGSRTDQGLISILSAFPAQPDKSIIKYTSKVQQLPSLIEDLKNNSYSSSFYYGGELEFANIAAYLRQAGIQRISDKQDYTTNQINSKWGAHDEYVLKHQANDLMHEKQAFFSVLLTLSNHEPFEIPHTASNAQLGDADRFRQAAAYTDQCLGNYFDAIKKTDWYKKSLFVLVADHGHYLPNEVDLNQPESKHIPLLLLGGALKDSLRGTTINTIGNQEDIAATLLYQLGIPHTKYKWSKNLLSSSAPQFAYYANQNVLGWVTPKDTLIYSFVQGKNIHQANPTSSGESLAKSYLQELYEMFLKL